MRTRLETSGRQARGAQPRSAHAAQPSPGEGWLGAPRPGVAGRRQGSGAQTPQAPGAVPRAHRSPVASGAMRPPTTHRCTGRALRNPCGSLLALTLALFVGMGHAQRDPVGRYEPAGREANRLRRPGGSHPAAAAAKVYSLFREQDAPVPGLPPTERAQLGWGSARRPANALARRPPRAQQPRRAQPPAQTWRSSPLGQQQPAVRARAAPALPRLGTPQRPGAAPPTPPRGRLTG